MEKKKAGRPSNYGEPTKTVRVPLSMVDRVIAWIKSEVKVK